MNSSSGRQKSQSMTSGTPPIFPVWIRVAVSKISSRVPSPPSGAMKAREYFTSNTSVRKVCGYRQDVVATASTRDP